MCTIHPRCSYQGDTRPNDCSNWIRAHRVQSGTHHTGATYSPLSDALRGKSGLVAEWVLCDSIPTYSKNQCCMIAASDQFDPHDLAAMLTQTPRLRAPLLGSLRKFFSENFLLLTVATQNLETMWFNCSVGWNRLSLFAPHIPLVNHPTRINT